MEKAKNLKTLLKWVRIWLGFHTIFLCIAFWKEVLPCIGLKAREKIPFAQAINSEPLNLFNMWKEALMKNNGEPQANFVSNLFVIWTVITAILIFYMERKENHLCGVRHWDIVSYRLSKFEKRAVIVVIFVEAGLLLIENIVFLPGTLLCLGLLLWVTVLIMFIFVSLATNEECLKGELAEIIAKESRTGSNKEISKRFFDFFRKAEEEDFDFLLDDIIEKIFDDIEISRLDDMLSDEYIRKSKFVSNLCNKVRQNPLKTLFAENFIDKVANRREFCEQEGRKNTAELLLFPLIEAKDKSCLDGLAVIQDENIRRETLMDCYVVAAYLNQKYGYESIESRLIEEMENNALIIPQNYKKCLEFWEKYKSYCIIKEGMEKEFDETFLSDMKTFFES